MRPAMRPEDGATLSWLRERVAEMMHHLREHHGDDPRAQAMFKKVADVQLLPEAEINQASGSWRNGKFKHSTGVLYVAGRDNNDELRTHSSLLKTVVHELAHATRFKEPGESSHSQQWKQTWLWLLEVATQALGWDVEVRCSQCTYYGLCEPHQCPKCKWMANLCKPYTGAPLEQHAPLAKYA